MAIDPWSIACTVLSDLILTDPGPLPGTIWQVIVAGWAASLAIGALAVATRVPPLACVAVFALMAVKELAMDIPRGGFTRAIWADAHNDLAMPVLGLLFTLTLTRRIKR